MSAITEKAMKEYQKGAMFDLIHSYKEQEDNTHLVVTAKKAAESTASDELQETKNDGQIASVQQNTEAQQPQKKEQKPQSNNLQQFAAKKAAENPTTNSQVGYGAPKAFTAPSTTSQSETKTTQFTAPQTDVEKTMFSEPDNTNIVNNHQFGETNNTNTTENEQPTQSQQELNQQQKKELASQPAKVRKQAAQHVIKTPDTNSSILTEIKSATNIANIIKQAYQTQVDTHPHNFDQLPVEKINLTNLKDGTNNSYLPIDQELFHSVDSVLIGEYQDILIIFRDGTPLHFAPETWLTSDDAKALLINQNYEFAYTDLDMQSFREVLNTVSSTIINNPKYTQYMIDFLPILN